MTEEDAQRGARERAIQRVALELQQPDQLARVRLRWQKIILVQWGPNSLRSAFFKYFD